MTGPARTRNWLWQGEPLVLFSRLVARGALSPEIQRVLQDRFDLQVSTESIRRRRYLMRRRARLWRDWRRAEPSAGAAA